VIDIDKDHDELVDIDTLIGAAKEGAGAMLKMEETGAGLEISAAQYLSLAISSASQSIRVLELARINQVRGNMGATDEIARLMLK
jgi:hypothetical protein